MLATYFQILQLEFKKSQHWNTFVKFDYLFITTGSYRYNHQLCTMSGCIATSLKVDKEGSYNWYSLPQLNVELQVTREKLQVWWICLWKRNEGVWCSY